MRLLSTHPVLALAFLSLALSACADEATLPPAPDGAANLSRAGTTFEYVQIAYPGAVFTGASGINSRGDIVGSYVDAANLRTHGYFLRKGVFTSIDYPGAILTEARGISPDGEIVGTYRMSGEPGWMYHGFLLTTAGEFKPIDYPGLPATMAQRILPDSTILGCHHGVGFAGMEGVVMRPSGDYSEADDIPMSMHNGATPDLSQIVGLYTDMMSGQARGYVINHGVFESFVVPGGIMTAAWDVNPAGQVVGVYRTSDLRFHGFVRTRDEYAAIDYPGATATRAFGINARGDVVGTYHVGSTGYGFLATSHGRPSR
jgi:uncharacterized membrane protein